MHKHKQAHIWDKCEFTGEASNSVLLNLSSSHTIVVVILPEQYHVLSNQIVFVLKGAGSP